MRKSTDIVHVEIRGSWNEYHDRDVTSYLPLPEGSSGTYFRYPRYIRILISR